APNDGGPWCIPAGELRGVEVASHHAGKEVYADKVLIVDWQLGPAVLRSGFALDEETAPAWAARLGPRGPPWAPGKRRCWSWRTGPPSPVRRSPPPRRPSPGRSCSTPPWPATRRS